MKFLDTNADNVNKREELRDMADLEKPDGIAIMETKPRETAAQPKTAKILNKDSFKKDKLLEGRESDDRTTLKFLYTNADNVMNKREELRAMADLEKPDVIAITEAKPKSAAAQPTVAEVNMEGYTTIASKNFETTGRGVYLLVREDLKINPIEQLTNHDFGESAWCSIGVTEQKAMLVGVIYRSPNSTEVNNSKMMELIREATQMAHSEVVIMGDFNMPDLAWRGDDEPREGSLEDNFIETLEDCYLEQMVNEPTRHRVNQRSNVLDLVLMEEKNDLAELKISHPLGKSDHATIMFTVRVNAETREAKPTLRYRKAELETMRDELGEIRWEKEIDGTTVEESWTKFKKILNECQERNIPRAKANKGGRKRQPWMTPEVRKSLKRKKTAYRTYTRSKKAEDWETFREERRAAKKAVRGAHQEYEGKIAEETKENPKAFWGYVNSKMKTRQGICDIRRKDGTLASEDGDRAEVLNEFFASVFTVEVEGRLPQINTRDDVEATEMKITEDRVLKKLKQLKEGKSPGPDQFHPFILKNLADHLAQPLTMMFNQSMKEGKLPKEWKEANITAIFKKGDRNEPGNYRPVSLTSVICKLMEQLVREELVEHMTKNNLFCKEQHGFMKGRSTITNLLETLDDWTGELEKGKSVDVMYLDFKKAFDKVPHRRLVKKIEQYGVSKQTTKWIEDFLSGRKQRVLVNGTASSERPVTSGVPQGSVLGPVLFLIYINDLPDNITSKCKIFADDTKLYRVSDEEEDRRTLQEDLTKLDRWAEEWQMEFNVDKCAVLHQGKNNGEADYTMKGKVLAKSDGEKDLGVTVDKKLNFKKHIQDVRSKASRTLGIVKRNFKNLKTKHFTTVYKTMVRSKLEYANCIWNPRLEGGKDCLERVQRRATKLIPHLKDKTYSERLEALKMPTLEYRRRRGDLIQTYKISQKIDRMEEGFLKLNNNRKTRGNSQKLEKQHLRTAERRNFFSERVVNNWNKLPETAVAAANMNKFKAEVEESKVLGNKYSYKNWSHNSTHNNR